MRTTARPERKALYGGSILSSALGLAALLVPKCPACLLGYLAVLGLAGLDAATVSHLIAPFGVLLLVVPWLVWLRRGAVAP